MPIYEYRCESCQQVTEVLQKMSDPPPATCEKCDKGPMQKMMSQTSFVLKGTGWYVTDFRDKKTPKKANESSSADEGTTKGSDSDSKSSAKEQSSGSAGSTGDTTASTSKVKEA